MNEHQTQSQHHPESLKTSDKWGEDEHLHAELTDKQN